MQSLFEHSPKFEKNQHASRADEGSKWSLTALYKHPLTDKGLAAFISDWEGTGQSIL